MGKGGRGQASHMGIGVRWPFLLLLCISLAVPPSLATTDYYAPEQVLSFALHLYEEGDYLRAAGELQRYRALVGEEAMPDSLWLRLAGCYREGGQTSRSLEILDRLTKGEIEDDRACEIAWETALLHYRMGDFRSCLARISQVEENEASGGACTSGSLALLKGASLLMERRWTEALQTLRTDTMEISHADHSVAVSLERIAADGLEMKRKSLILAGLLSAAIPGSGKIYAGRTVDGLYSLSTIAVTAWQAERGFSKDGAESTRGWIFATLGFGFYVGNVYGSVLAARQHNDRLELALLYRTRNAMDRPFPGHPNRR